MLAKIVDVAMRRVQLRAGAETRYRVLRRAVMAVIIIVAVLSALLVFPQVRAVAGALLASGAVVGIIVGFASQRTLGNFVAGILIAFTQPLRLGDRVTIDGVEGVVEEITLTYTFIRADDDTRLWSRTRNLPRIPSTTRPSSSVRSVRRSRCSFH